MKRIFITPLLLFAVVALFAQYPTITYSGLVVDAQGNPVANQAVIVSHPSGFGSPFTYLTNGSGVFSGSLLAGGTWGPTTFSSQDNCGTVSINYETTPINYSNNIQVGLMLCNNGGASNCSYSMSHQSNGNDSVSFTSSLSNTPGNTYMWNFGDGNYSTAANPTHVYRQPKTYAYSLQINGCSPIFDSITIAPKPPQTAYIAIYIIDSAGNPVPNYQLPLSILSPPSVPHYKFSDSNGLVQDTVIVQGAGYILGGYAWSGPTTCYDSAYFYFDGSTPDVYFFDTIGYQCNTLSATSCNYSVNATQLPFMANTVGFSTNYFKHSSRHYTWDFGDGTTSVSPSPYHTYAAPGTYVYCLQVEDCPPVCDSIVVQASSPPQVNCNAVFTVDTVNSLLGNAVVWNMSSATATNLAQPNISYHWDFGDGATSNLPFPTHNYVDTGLFQVCLTITAILPANAQYPADTCVHTFCDTLGMDANGNLIYKNSQVGWTLNVLDPKTMSIAENPMEEIILFPNPANEVVVLKIAEMPQSDAQLQIMDMSGAVVYAAILSTGTDHSIDIAKFSSGVYILSLKVGAASVQMKLMKY